MTNEQLFTQLHLVCKQLRESYTERATTNAMYHTTRYAIMENHMQGGDTPTAARQWADMGSREFRAEVDKLDAEIASLVEQRDHLRFCADHGWMPPDA